MLLISTVSQCLFSPFITGCHNFSVNYIQEQQLCHTEKNQLLYNLEITLQGNMEETMYVPSTTFYDTFYLKCLMY